VKSLGEILSLSVQYLQERKVPRARLVAEMILAHQLKIGRMDLYMRFECPIEETELSWVRQALKRAASFEPVEYITEEIEFYHGRFTVTSAVLIPRPETEILVDKAVKEIRQRGSEGKILLDLCGGSGCIGISIKKACPELTVFVSDISQEALAVCRENRQKNGVDVEVLQGDLFSPFEGNKADYLLCNPPYISQSEYGQLDASVKDYEPKIALVAGESGLEFYQKLSFYMKDYLNSGALVFLEIGQGQGEAIKGLFSDPCWIKKRLEQDWAGKDRFFFLEKE